MAFTWLVGTMVDRFSYTPIFILAGLMPIVALLVVEWLIPRIPATATESAPPAEDKQPG